MSSPEKSAHTTYTGNSLDFDLFALHSNVYKNEKTSIKLKPTQIDQAQIIQAQNIIKEYINFLHAFNFTKNTNNTFTIKAGYEKDKPFFELIHGIISTNIDKTNALKIINQSKIIMAAVDSLLLSKLVNKQNIQTLNDKTFSSVNPSSIEDLVMNSISTTNTVSISNPNIIEQISSIISSINNCVITNKYPTSNSQSLVTKNVPSLDTFGIIIKNNTQTLTTSTPVTPLTPEDVLSLLNTIVTRSVMKTPELKTLIIKQIIKKGYFVVGGNIKCQDKSEFQINDLTNIYFLINKPEIYNNNLLKTLPPTIITLEKLNNTICTNTDPKNIYIVGNLYCINDELISPDLDDIIGIYDSEPSNLENPNNGFFENDYKVESIRKELNIDNFCSKMNNKLTLELESKKTTPTQNSRNGTYTSIMHKNPRIESKDESYKKHLESEMKKQKEREAAAKKIAENKKKSKTTNWHGGNNYTRKKHLIINNSKTRKNYYDNDKSNDDNELNEFMHE